MATGWYGRSVAAASLTRLPRGICCGVCGLTEPTPDSTEDGPADTAAAWAAMTRHVLETHCTPCCVCGEAAGGLIELRTGTLAPWVRRSRAPSALHALRARRRTQQRDRDRLERAQAAPAPPRARAVGATRGGVSVRRVPTRATPAPGLAVSSSATPFAGMSPLAAARARREAAVAGAPAPRLRDRLRAQYAAERDVVDLTAPHPAELAGLAVLERGPPPRRARRDAAVYYDLTAQRPASAVPRARTQCAHCACERCARETATRALHSDDGRVACPAEGCQASLSLETLAALLPPEENQAARNRPAFDCVACGERVARRDTIALHRQLPYHHALALAPPPPPAQVNGQQSACDMCAPCAARWLEIQARDGAIYTRCPTPGCKTPLPREALELLLEPEAYQAHLARARRSYEQRLRDLQARTAAGSNDDDDGTAAFLAWAGDSTRACPECHVLIYRSEGCAHMSCACGAEFNWDSAERVGGSSAAPPPTAPGARRVVGAEDIAALLPPAFPDTLAGVGLLPGGSARRRPAQLGGATVSALDLELERARSRALQQELDRTRARLRQIGATAAAVTAVSPAAGPTPPPVFAPALADSGLVVANPTAGTAEAPPAPPPRRSKRAAAASSPGAPKKRR